MSCWDHRTSVPHACKDRTPLPVPLPDEGANLLSGVRGNMCPWGRTPACTTPKKSDPLWTISNESGSSRLACILVRKKAIDANEKEHLPICSCNKVTTSPQQTGTNCRPLPCLDTFDSQNTLKSLLPFLFIISFTVRSEILSPG